MNRFSKWVKENYTGRDVVVSLQHMLTMIGATILVPLSCGMNISMTMLCAGIGTIIFFFITKKKVPVFLGSSFAFLGAYKSIMGDGVNALAGETVENLFSTNYDLWCRNMGRLVVALWMAGLLYVIFSFIVKFVGVEKIKKIFGPIIVGPIVMLIGFTLSQSIFQSDIVSQFAVEEPWKVVSTAIVTILTIVGINAYCKPKSIFRIMPIICGFFVGTVYAVIIGYNFDIHFSGSVIIFQDIFAENSVLGFWKNISFDFNAMIQVLPIALVSMMEHLGDISANSVVCGKDFLVDPGVDKTLLGDGVATAFAGLLGGPSNTTYSENTAVLVMTKNYKPTTVFLAAIFATILGMFVPIAEVIKAIPAPVIGGSSIVLFGMISASGLRNLIDNKVDLSKMKNMLVVSLTLSIGLGLSAVGGITIGAVNISALCVATFVAIFLNFVIPNEKTVSEDEKKVENAEVSVEPTVVAEPENKN